MEPAGKVVGEYSPAAPANEFFLKQKFFKMAMFWPFLHYPQFSLDIFSTPDIISLEKGFRPVVHILQLSGRSFFYFSSGKIEISHLVLFFFLSPLI